MGRSAFMRDYFGRRSFLQGTKNGPGGSGISYPPDWPTAPGGLYDPNLGDVNWDGQRRFSPVPELIKALVIAAF
jgi:hypothetical protein